jgi:hypothetical protein
MKINKKVLPVNSEVLVDLKNIESPVFSFVQMSVLCGIINLRQKRLSLCPSLVKFGAG